MTLLVSGLLVFFATHLVRVFVPGLRSSMIDKLGPLGWKGVYSLVSLAGFAMIVLGYAGARWTSPVLWGAPTPAMRMAVGLVMAAALVVFIAAYLPGWIRATLRHPMMLATAAWAAAHLAVNGRVADILLFGGFLAWSLIVLVASYRRPWTPSPRKPSVIWDIVAVAVGIGIWWWLVFGGGHIRLFTMPAM